MESLPLESLRKNLDLSIDIKSIQYLLEADSWGDDSIAHEHFDYEPIFTRYRYEEKKEEKRAEPSENYLKKARTLTRTISGKLFLKEDRIKTELNESCSSPKLDPNSLKLHQAIRQQMPLNKFTKLLKKYPNVDLQDSNLQTPLHICSSFGFVPFMKVLIKKGSNINLQDMNGFTPLHLSLIEAHLEASALLLETKLIDPKITNNEKTSVLHYLVRVPVDENNVVLYRRIMDLLIENGLDVNMQNKHGEGALHSACLRGNFQAAAFLVERGADCNLPNVVGETSLHYATRIGNIKLVRLLMENGANPTIQGDDGFTPIDIAEEYQYTDMLDCLQVIIGEAIDGTIEKVRQSSISMSMASPRFRINENFRKQGWLECYYNNQWEKRYIKSDNQTLICTLDPMSHRVLFMINLTGVEVGQEEGIVMNENSEPMWCFTVTEQYGTQYYFATFIPEERDSWYQVLYDITYTHNKLNGIYEKLKNLSLPRKNLHKSYQKVSMRNAFEGSRYLIHSLNDKTPIEDVMNTISNNIAVYSATLSEILNIDDDNVIKNVVNFFHYQNLFPDFIKAAIFYDISKTINGETLFREMSLSTRLLSVYLEGDEGREYLRSTVLPLVTSIASIDQNLEVNPKAQTIDNNKKIDIKANLEKICEISQVFLDKVLSSANSYPIVFRDIMLFTRKTVDTIFPNMTHAVVGGFVFLRYLCPAIVSPYKYGLVSKMPDSKSLRVLILVSKLLQSVSNGVEFDGSKEDYMQNLNPFIRRNRLHVNIFFDNLTNASTIPQVLPQVNKSDEDIKVQSEMLYSNIVASQKNLDKVYHSLNNFFQQLEDRVNSSRVDRSTQAKPL